MIGEEWCVRLPVQDPARPSGRGLLVAEAKVTTMARALGRRGGELRPGDHVIVIYEDPPELLMFAVPFIKDGLAKDECCVYVADDLQPTEVTAALAKGGVDVKREIKRGALVMSTPQEYYALPTFDSVRVVALTRRRAAEAISRGFTGLRIAGEMTWTLQAGIRNDVLVEYESLLDEAIGPPSLPPACIEEIDSARPCSSN